MKTLEKQTDAPTFEFFISDFWSKYSEFAKERDQQNVNSSANVRYLESFSTKAQEKKKDQFSILSTTGFVHYSKVGLQFSAASPSGKAPWAVMRDKVLI